MLTLMSECCGLDMAGSIYNGGTGISSFNYGT